MRPERAADLRAAVAASADSLLAYFERRVRHREDAADLLAETMLQAWRRSDALPHETERQQMWLYTIAANVLANHNRATRRRTALAERLRAQLRQAQVPDPAEVRDAVTRLPEAQRELVMLIHWDGLTIVEAAGVLGIKASTARSRYSTAREQLRLALTDITAPR